MNEEDKETAHIALIEAMDLLYVLEVALNNDEQPTSDMTSYAFIAKLIKRKVAGATELIWS